MLSYKSRMEGADRVMKILLEAVIYSLIYSVFMLILFRSRELSTSSTIIPRQSEKEPLKKGLSHRKS